MAYRNKSYVCFDGDEDIKYYRLMTAWKANKGLEFNFHDAHDLNYARDSSLEESIKKQLRARFANSKTLVVLIGEKTRYLQKFVKWEMQVALKLGLPIIAVNLDGSRVKTGKCPSTISDELAVHIPFGMKIMQYTLDHWPQSHAHYNSAGEIGPRWYKPEVYTELGI